jgi:hypothetical protein
VKISKKTIGFIGAAAVLVAITSTGAPAEAAKLLTGKNIKDGSLTLKDFKASERAKLVGPQGPAGMPGQPAALNTVIVESPDVFIGAGNLGVAIAYCPAGTKVTGGGYYSDDSIAYESVPNTPNSWGAQFDNYSDYTITVSAYAVCAA